MNINPLLFLHLFAIGMWLACVIIEFMIETDKRFKDVVAPLHGMIDRYLEIPLLLVVLFTGGLMLRDTPLSTMLIIKIVLALGAIGVNIFCALPVIRRNREFQKAPSNQKIGHYRKQIMVSFALGTPMGLSAFTLGILMMIGINLQPTSDKIASHTQENTSVDFKSGAGFFTETPTETIPTTALNKAGSHCLKVDQASL